MSWNRGIRSFESENVSIKISKKWSKRFLNENREKKYKGGMRRRMMPQPRQLGTARRMVSPDLRGLGCLGTKKKSSFLDITGLRVYIERDTANKVSQKDNPFKWRALVAQVGRVGGSS